MIMNTTDHDRWHSHTHNAAEYQLGFFSTTPFFFRVVCVCVSDGFSNSNKPSDFFFIAGASKWNNQRETIFSTQVEQVGVSISET